MPPKTRDNKLVLRGNNLVANADDNIFSESGLQSLLVGAVEANVGFSLE